MLDCLILGDSIAKGLSDIRKECTAIVKSGINSKDFVAKNPGPFAAKTVIVSLGSNDVGTMTERSIRKLREQMAPGQTVWWVLPNKKEIARIAILKVANEYDDYIIDVRSQRTHDSVHPTYNGYKNLARETKKHE